MLKLEDRWDYIRPLNIDIFQPVAYELGLNYRECVFLSYVFDTMQSDRDSRVDMEDGTGEFIRIGFTEFLEAYPILGFTSRQEVSDMVVSLVKRGVLHFPDLWIVEQDYITLVQIDEELIFMLFISDYSMVGDVYEEWEKYRIAHHMDIPNYNLPLEVRKCP